MTASHNGTMKALHSLRVWVGVVAGLLCLPHAGLGQTLLLRYTFDEAASGTGTAYDSSGASPQSNGTFASPGTRIAPGAGGVGIAAMSTGSGGYVSAGASSKLDGLTKFTLTAWINLQSNPGNGNSLMGKRSTASTGFGFLYGNPTEGGSPTASDFTLKLKVLATTSGSTSADINAAGAWVFVAVTYDGTLTSGNVKFYTGNAGTSVAQSGGTANLNGGTVTANADAFLIGKDGNANGPQAWMDDVRVYTGILTSAQLETVRKANLPPALSWDRNGATAGAGTGGTAAGVWSGSGVWATANNWNSDPAGSDAREQWSDGAVANFSAGTDATGSYTVTLSNAPTASAINIQEGAITFGGIDPNSYIKLAGGAVDVASGASATFSPATVAGTAGLLKTSAGILTLGGANAYSGDTTVSAGTLALSGSGSIASSANITVASGATLDVTGRSDGTLTLVSGQTLKGEGQVSGSITALSGAYVKPGVTIGTLSVGSAGAVTLQSGSTTEMQVSRGATPNADKLQGIGALTEGGTLNVVNAGASLQVNDSFTLFSATSYSGEFAAISPANPNNDAELAWDTPALKSSGVLQVHHVPYATNLAVFRSRGTPGKIPFTQLFPGTDPVDGDTVLLKSFTMGSQGATITTNATHLFYQPGADNNDAFDYTVTDQRGGERTATITIWVTNSVGSVMITNSGSGSMNLSFYGIPGYPYVVQRSCGDLTSWVDLATNAASGTGLIQYTDTPGGGCSPAFYRVRSE